VFANSGVEQDLGGAQWRNTANAHKAQRHSPPARILVVILRVLSWRWVIPKLVQMQHLKTFSQNQRLHSNVTVSV
jgi:hypothetical protein